MICPVCKKMTKKHTGEEATKCNSIVEEMIEETRAIIELRRRTLRLRELEVILGDLR